jgi:holliday junction DNA helicase RuvA
MIAQLRGRILDTSLEKDVLRVVIDIQGVGYEVLAAKSAEARIAVGQTLTFFVSESVTAFDGATTLYGFVTKEEKDFFICIRENVDGMGPKKALECMDKISKSLPDFKRAVIDSDLSLLVSVFGFTKKTAEKLIFSLKDKVSTWPASGPVRWADAPIDSQEAEAVSGLLHMGYREEEARELVAKAKSNVAAGSSTETILQEALRLMGSKL